MRMHIGAFASFSARGLIKTLGATLKSMSEEKYRFTYHSRAVYPIGMGLRMPGGNYKHR